MMNGIWLGLVLISILCAGWTGQMRPLTLRCFEAAREASAFSLGLIGVMAFWLGVMRVAQDGGLLALIARRLRRPMRWLFPEVPEDHPAMSAMIMNFSANLLGLGNAATPFGIRAMTELNKLNPDKGTATDAMCLFLAINTSGLAILPTGVMGMRAVAGSRDPASIWLPTLLSTAAATCMAILAAKYLRRTWRSPIVLPAGRVVGDNPPASAASPDDPLEPVSREPGTSVSRPRQLFVFSCGILFVALAVITYARIWTTAEGLHGAARASRGWAEAFAPLFSSYFALERLDGVGLVKDFFSFWTVPALLMGFLLFGYAHGVKIYESLVQGAKEGFEVAVRIIPYLVAIMVAVAMFDASGAMRMLQTTLGSYTAWLGMPAEVLPMAILRPLSGSGAMGYMNSMFLQYGPDSFTGQLVSVLQGCTETTFYVLSVYFGAVQVTRFRYALAAGLLADLAGVVAAVALCHWLF